MKKKDFVFCRTPLQAKILLKLIEDGVLECFDLLYLTNNNSNKDLYYYRKLSAVANKSKYIKLMGKRFLYLDLVFLSYFLSFFNKKEIYNIVYISNINHVFFRVFLNGLTYSSLVTFDDGTANIINSSRFYISSLKSRIFCNLIGLPSVNKLIKRVDKHYSLYKGFDNIVPSDIIEFIDPFDNGLDSPSNMKSCNIFIGQPFEEYLSSSDIERLKSWLKYSNINFYVMHPREKKPIISDVEVMDTEGMIIEDYISQNLNHLNVNVYALFSTVLFNINFKKVNKFYIHIESSGDKGRLELIKKTNSEVIKI